MTESEHSARVALKLDIVVIGAGQAGLSSAYHLKQLGLTPGRVADQAGELADSLCALLLPGDVVFATRHLAGGADHKATVAAARMVAAELGLALYESVAGAPAGGSTGGPQLAVPMDPDMRERKQAALTGMPGATPRVGPVELLAA